MSVAEETAAEFVGDEVEDHFLFAAIIDYIIILHGTARGDDCGDPGLDESFNSIDVWKKAVTCSTGTSNVMITRSCSFERKLCAIDPCLLTHAVSDELPILNDRDRVTVGGVADSLGEEQVQLLGGGCLSHSSQIGIVEIQYERIVRLTQEASSDVAEPWRSVEARM